jgi:hypothetical protein
MLLKASASIQREHFNDFLAKFRVDDAHPCRFVPYSSVAVDNWSAVQPARNHD